jgi:hypothetical protein
VIGNGRQLREFTFTETVFERQTLSDVAPKIFEPEPELTGNDNESGKPGNADKISESARPPVFVSPVKATAEDEVEVLRLLNDAGVFMRDQVSVSRTPKGQLVVAGIVETDERKKQIVGVLAPMTQSRPIRVEVESVAEVLQRQQARATAAPVTVESGQVTETQIPVDAELRQFLSRTKGLSGEQLDNEVRQFGERMLARSNQARLQVLALKPVIERFSSEELQALTPDARNKWRSIVIERVRSFAAETAALRRELAPLFPMLSGTAGSSGEFDLSSDADLVRAVRQLMQLAAANDEAIRRSFAISASGGKSAPVRTTQFWNSFVTAESLANNISRRFTQ